MTDNTAAHLATLRTQTERDLDRLRNDICDSKRMTTRLVWDSKEIFKLEHKLSILEWWRKLSANVDESVAIRNFRHQLTEAMLRWQPAGSTCPLNNYAHEQYFAAMQSILRLLPR
jgi:hypothetical protein